MSQVAEQIKSRIDILSYIGQFVTLKKAGRHHKGCCPFHNEKTASFMIDADKQTWHCYGACAEGGDVIEFAMKKHGWSFPETLRELGKQVGIEVEQRQPRQDKSEALRGLLKVMAEEYHRLLLESPVLMQYLREKRGLTDATIQHFQLGYAPGEWQYSLEHLKKFGGREDDVIAAGLAIRPEAGRTYDRFRNRLMIPIRDDRGRVVGFGARTLSAEDNPKYLNSPQSVIFDKSRLLFGLDMAKRSIRESKTAVIVEGYMDVIQAHQAGFTNVVAQMGTAITEPQLKLLAPDMANRIILALDADTAGQSATRRSLEVAHQALQNDYSSKLSADILILQIPDAKDPDDFLKEHPDQWQGLIDGALPAADYLIDAEASKLPLAATVAQRISVAKALLPMLMATESNIYRMDNVQKLALRLRIPEAELMALAPRGKAAPAQEVKVEAPVTRDPLQAYCIRSLVNYDGWYSEAFRKFRQIGIEDFGAADFTDPDYRTMFEVFMRASKQDDMDVIDYIYQYTPEEQLTLLEGDEPLDKETFICQALRLRLTRLTNEAAQAIAESRLEDARLLIRAKAQLLQHL